LYETLEELKNIVSSGGVVSADDSRTGIASDVSYIKEKLDIMQSENGGVKGAVQGSSALTLELIVGQLDRLFDDIKNVADALEANVMDNLAIINDNVNIIKESVDKVGDKIGAFANSFEEVHEIKQILSLRYEDDATFVGGAVKSETSTLLENQNEMLKTLLETARGMQEKMDRMSEDLAQTKQENAKIKQSVEKLFIEVDEGAPAIDSVKEVLSSLNVTVENAEEKIEENASEELDSILEKIDDALAQKKD
jgi:chromosome segregation ATPase